MLCMKKCKIFIKSINPAGNTMNRMSIGDIIFYTGPQVHKSTYYT